MNEFLVAIPAFIVAISVLVAIHEFGHYWVARRLGIKVLRFSIGFGRPLWRRVGRAPDHVEYVVSAIPLGGYVKMLDEREGDVAPADLPRAFNRAPVRNRMAVLVAGPAFNLIFASLAYWVLFMAGVPGVKPVIGEVEPDSYAYTAGLEADDEIIRVDGKDVATWEAAQIAILQDMISDGRIVLTVRRDGGAIIDAVLDVGSDAARLTEPGQLPYGIGIQPWSPKFVPRLDTIEAGSPADRAGFLSGDLVLEADGQAFSSWGDWVTFIQARPNQTTAVTVLRDGSERTLQLALASVENGDRVVGRMGASVQVPREQIERNRATQKFTPLTAAWRGVEKTWDMSVLILKMFGHMITGQVSLKNISGPINIAQYAGYTASNGPVQFLHFLAVVSISLGILNLLPIPMLDGGQLVYQFVELVKGSPISVRAEIVGQQVGIMFLLMLMSFAFYNDIARLFG